MALIATSIEIDSVLKISFKHLHSSNPDSAEKIRIALDEIIKQRFGSSKMLINTLNKKIISEENTVSESNKIAEPKVNTNLTVIKCVSTLNSCDTISIASEEENFTEFGDLVCVLCGAMVVVAGNRLVECRECFSLYHQECHKPSISDNDANAEDSHWICYNCKHKLVSPNVITDLTLLETELPLIPTQQPKTHDVLPSVSTKVKNFVENNKDADSTSSNTNIKNVCTTNIVSADKPISDKRLQSMKKKTKHQDSKRKK